MRRTAKPLASIPCYLWQSGSRYAAVKRCDGTFAYVINGRTQYLSLLNYAAEGWRVEWI